MLKNVLIFFVILCSAGFLFAEDNTIENTNKEKQSVRSGLFINIGGGYNYGYDVKVEQDIRWAWYRTDYSDNAVRSGRINSKSTMQHNKGGLVGKASLGYEWKNHALAVSIQQNDVEYKSEKDFSDGNKAKMTIKSNDVMLAYYYKFNTNSNFVPYVGVSAGMGFTKTEFADFESKEYQMPVAGINVGLQYNISKSFSVIGEVATTARYEKDINGGYSTVYLGNNLRESTRIDNKLQTSVSSIFGAYIKYYIW